MIAMDAGVLSLMIYGQSAVPKDFKTDWTLNMREKY